MARVGVYFNDFCQNARNPFYGTVYCKNWKSTAENPDFDKPCELLAVFTAVQRNSTHKLARTAMPSILFCARHPVRNYSAPFCRR